MDLAVGEAKGGEELAFVGMIRDITEQKDFYQALAEARAKAEAASRAKSELLSRLAPTTTVNPSSATNSFARTRKQLSPNSESA